MKELKTWIKALIVAILLAIMACTSACVVVFGYNYIISRPMPKIITVKYTQPSYDYLKSVTVRIYQMADDGNFIGTGTIVKLTKDYTYILTNRHVASMSNKDRIYVIDEYKEKLQAEVVADSRTVDLSLIRVQGRIRNKSVVKKISSAVESNRIYSVGMYLGYYYIYTEGTVAGYDNQDNFVMNLPGSSGCSGSGVFNSNGDLVAVVFASNYINFPYQTETSKLLCLNTWEIKFFLKLNNNLMR